MTGNEVLYLHPHRVLFQKLDAIIWNNLVNFQLQLQRILLYRNSGHSLLLNRRNKKWFFSNIIVETKFVGVIFVSILFITLSKIEIEGLENFPIFEIVVYIQGLFSKQESRIIQITFRERHHGIILRELFLELIIVKGICWSHESIHGPIDNLSLVVPDDRLDIFKFFGVPILLRIIFRVVDIFAVQENLKIEFFGLIEYFKFYLHFLVPEFINLKYIAFDNFLGAKCQACDCKTSFKIIGLNFILRRIFVHLSYQGLKTEDEFCPLWHGNIYLQVLCYWLLQIKYRMKNPILSGDIIFRRRHLKLEYVRWQTERTFALYLVILSKFECLVIFVRVWVKVAVIRQLSI